MEMVKLRDFWKTRKERNESFSTVVVVAGITFFVVVYDLCAKTTHEVWISVEGYEKERNITLRIPEIRIYAKESLTESIQEAVEKIYRLQVHAG